MSKKYTMVKVVGTQLPCIGLGTYKACINRTVPCTLTLYLLEDELKKNPSFTWSYSFWCHFQVPCLTLAG